MVSHPTTVGFTERNAMLSPEELFATRIVPVVVCEDAALADPLGDALLAGGLPVAEVTFRTPAAADTIRRLARRPGLIVGAGTVLRPDQVDVAADAGARFVVSPGTTAAVVARAADRGLLVLPGAITPSEIMAALDLGLSTLKFFPAGQFGGAATIQGYASPFGGVRFVPTGGVTAANLADYLALPNVPAVGGSWMVAPRLLASGDFETIARLSAEAVATASA